MCWTQTYVQTAILSQHVYARFDTLTKQHELWNGSYQRHYYLTSYSPTVDTNIQIRKTAVGVVMINQLQMAVQPPINIAYIQHIHLSKDI